MQSSDSTTINLKLEKINKAREAIRGDDNLNVEELRQLCKELEILDQFAYATEILLIIIRQEEKAGKIFSLKNYQTLAKYIYKDQSLPSSFKFEKALNELNSHDDLYQTGKCESLGLAGAIYKRKWQFDHQFKNLFLSQYYYQKGFQQWKFFTSEQAAGRSCDVDFNDDGYTAINYAFINDLMAVDKMEAFGKSTGVTEEIIQNLDEARKTREYILDQMVIAKDASGPELKIEIKNNPWIIATVAEAYFGLHDYNKAKKFIDKYLEIKSLHPWEIRSFNQQIFSLAYLQLCLKKFYDTQLENKVPGNELLKNYAGRIIDKKMNEYLEVFNKTENPHEKHTRDIEINNDDKVGLALSGGGFRASLFHIGVLAALAENNKLKDIEIISCVSGGSIIGAYYYLKLKKVLEENTDGEIEKKHYLQIVKEIEKEFLAGVQKNLRMQIFSNLGRNFKMLYDKHYSRSHRIGELYEKYFYNNLSGKNEPGKDKLYMNDLYIQPKLNEGESFSFANDNWKRNHKVPQLVINATSVNTGHNWQFTASWMGEPPGNIQTDIDVKPRLRRMYYEEAPERYKKFRVGHAVGASACVPVMFHPMPLPELYPGIDLQLIDGGLHDNQGIGALIEQECNSMIISDASGQMPTNEVSTQNEAAIFFRADNILQERLRELQFMDIKERNATTQLNSLIKVHLKNGLKEYPISWINCIDPPRPILYEDDNTMNKDLLSYGILRSSQQLLAEIRTDLDSFNDIEAYSLMYSGYAQINYEYHKTGFPKAETVDWDFLKIHDYLKTPALAEKIKNILVTGKKLPFKVLDVSKPTKIILMVLGLIGLFLLGWATYKFSISPENKMILAKLLFIIIAIGIVGFVFKLLGKLFNYKSTFVKKLYMSLFMIAIFIFSNIYLGIFNGIYNKAGSLKE